MIMKNAKCTNCGANIEVNENSDAGVCKYCNAAYVTEKAIELYNSNVSNSSTNNANTIVNNYYNGPATQAVQENKVQYVRFAPPRPKINVGLAVFLCFFYIIPGAIYISSVKKKQEEWDEKYGG